MVKHLPRAAKSKTQRRASCRCATAVGDALTLVRWLCFVEKIDQITFAADGALQGDPCKHERVLRSTFANRRRRASQAILRPMNRLAVPVRLRAVKHVLALRCWLFGFRRAAPCEPDSGGMVQPSAQLFVDAGAPVLDRGQVSRMRVAPSNVCCWENSGKHLLSASISPFDPTRSAPGKLAKNRR
jgi:hypothetical protein